MCFVNRKCKYPCIVKVGWKSQFEQNIFQLICQAVQVILQYFIWIFILYRTLRVTLIWMHVLSTYNQQILQALLLIIYGREGREALLHRIQAPTKTIQDLVKLTHFQKRKNSKTQKVNNFYLCGLNLTPNMWTTKRNKRLVIFFVNS